MRLIETVKALLAYTVSRKHDKELRQMTICPLLYRGLPIKELINPERVRPSCPFGFWAL